MATNRDSMSDYILVLLFIGVVFGEQLITTAITMCIAIIVVKRKNRMCVQKTIVDNLISRKN